MKKLITIMLAFVMIFLLTACGNQYEKTNSDNSFPTNSDGASSADSDNSKTDKESESAFDTAWARNDFERLLPQPPFENWEIDTQTDTMYMITANNANEQEWTDYSQTLKDYGFTVKDLSGGFTATDSNGNYFEFPFYDNIAVIIIQLAD